MTSVTRLGDFWKLMPTNFLTKVAQIFGNFLGYCEKHYSVSKNCCGSFLDIVWEIWATFFSNIWSYSMKNFTVCERLKTNLTSQVAKKTSERSIGQKVLNWCSSFLTSSPRRSRSPCRSRWCWPAQHPEASRDKCYKTVLLLSLGLASLKRWPNMDSRFVTLSILILMGTWSNC